MWSVAVLLTLSAVSAERFTVTTLDGQKHEGEIVALGAEGLTLATNDGELKLPLNKLNQVSTPEVNQNSKIFVTLGDGSKLVGDEFTLTSGGGVLVGDGTQFNVPRRAIKSVRWRSSEAVDPLWQEALETTAAGDLLVIRKTSAAGDSGTSQTILDPLEGLVSGVGKASVAFEFDGDPINVNLSKVEGIVFYKPAAPSTAAPLCKVTAPNVGTLVAAEVKIKGTNLEVKTLSGVTIPVPLARGTSLDFRSGNLQWLADIEPDDVKTSFHLQPGGMKVKFSDLFAPGTEGPFGGAGLKIGAKPAFKSGLSLHSPTTMTFRIPAGFSLFQATVGLPDDAAAGAKLKLRVLADLEALFERDFATAGARGAVELECKVAGAKRLTIIVEAGEGLDFGDTIILGDARFVK